MLKQSLRQVTSRGRENASNIEVHPLFLDRIRKVQQARKKSERSTKDKAKDDLMSAYCTLNRTVNLLKKNERLLTPDLLKRFYLECESLNQLLRKLAMATNPREADIFTAKEQMRALFDSIRSFKCNSHST